LSDNLSDAILDAAKTINQPTVDQIVNYLVEQKGAKPTDATKAIYTEWKKGRLNLTQTNPPKNLPRYFFSLENTWFWAATTLVAVTALAIFTVESSSLLYVRYLLGGAFVLFLPGFMLILALYPRGEELDGLERAALSVGLSLAIVPIVGLALNYTPWGIRLEPIVITLAFLVEGLAVVGVFRKYRYHLLSLK
jgi:hypothetical protein